MTSAEATRLERAIDRLGDLVHQRLADHGALIGELRGTLLSQRDAIAAADARAQDALQRQTLADEAHDANEREMLAKMASMDTRLAALELAVRDRDQAERSERRKGASMGGAVGAGVVAVAELVRYMMRGEL